MELRPTASTASVQPLPPAEAEQARANAEPRSWRWMVIHFPCLEAVTPNGHIIVVSDKRHIPEGRRRYPDLVLWHVRELGMFGDLMDQAGLDEQTFTKVNLLKRRTRGWFMGLDRENSVVSENAGKASKS
jgi:hypothetical protein